ncbi:hypothetical protein GCM10027053_08660 [Intrasporangium mesophilum]
MSDAGAQVGVRELKAHLSAQLERVKAGQTVIVTERGRPIAEIRPVGAIGVLDELIASGLATRGTQSRWLPETLVSPSGSVVEVLLEERR